MVATVWAASRCSCLLNVCAADFLRKTACVKSPFETPNLFALKLFKILPPELLNLSDALHLRRYQQPLEFERKIINFQLPESDSLLVLPPDSQPVHRRGFRWCSKMIVCSAFSSPWVLLLKGTVKLAVLKRSISIQMILNLFLALDWWLLVPMLLDKCDACGRKVRFESSWTFFCCALFLIFFYSASEALKLPCFGKLSTFLSLAPYFADKPKENRKKS